MKEWKVDFSKIEVGEYFIQAKHLHKKVSKTSATDYEWGSGAYVFYFKPYYKVWRLQGDILANLTDVQKEIIKATSHTEEWMI